MEQSGSLDSRQYAFSRRAVISLIFRPLPPDGLPEPVDMACDCAARVGTRNFEIPGVGIRVLSFILGFSVGFKLWTW